MSDKLIQVEDAAASLLSSLDVDSVERAVIEEKVRAITAIQGNYSEQDIQIITRKLEERFNISMSLGILFAADDYRPWLNDARGDIEWYYWDRYKRLLNKQQFSPKVIRVFNSITDQILDHLENPNKAGQWARKGMVVGYVQSGKTANYIGLINKAADSGYRVIIVLAGTLNSLRNQTQFRVDNGFIGRDTEQKMAIGVGLLSNEKKPAYFTTNTKDFRKAVANQIGVGIGDLKEPVVLVVKKNKRTLENLIDWLKYNNPHNLKNYPMLLVDDEADHASINTNKDGELATTINRKIRELLHLFDRSSYVGYTATPFANVFIDPETESEMLGDDLFPRDFIISLDPPDNYVGSARVFSSDRDMDIVRFLNDYEDDLPLKHPKDWQPNDIPDSLKEAINIFILSRAIRLLRKQEATHNSMMINVSRYTAVQSNVKLLVDEYLKEIRQAIINHYKLTAAEALKNISMTDLKRYFENEFTSTGFNWDQIQPELKKAVSPIEVIEVNSSSAAEPLDYSRRNYPQGRNLIAVGGMSLSRGLTLEGLTVSYFLRNSVMYDTLMQMGRWFGYRDGYSDLCRIYMTPEAESWYTHISDVTDELREEFKRMKIAGMSPKDFGLCVRAHPESLIVTARNKMRTGIPITRQVSLEGRLVETSILLKKADALEANRHLLTGIVEEMLNIAEPLEGKNTSNYVRVPAGYLWSAIPVSIVKKFIENFRNHPASQLTNPTPLKSYIDILEKEELILWDIILISPYKETGKYKNIGGHRVNFQTRTVSRFGDIGIAVNKEKRRVGYAVQESAALPHKETTQAENKYKEDNPHSKSVPGAVYRKLRNELGWNPLLILHMLDCEEEGESLYSDGVAAYGISFPGEAGNQKPHNLVEYIVNTVWWKNEFPDLFDEEEENEDE
ncbi:Z1 domain-containing protein [Desulfobacterium sp. N47]|uniref:Z1 domain-containing protein n=1 Tax=Desulfobacterium sp. N47 TaxID=3115210 RepID=UPI003F4A3736